MLWSCRVGTSVVRCFVAAGYAPVLRRLVRCFGAAEYAPVLRDALGLQGTHRCSGGLRDSWELQGTHHGMMPWSPLPGSGDYSGGPVLGGACSGSGQTLWWRHGPLESVSRFLKFPILNC